MYSHKASIKESIYLKHFISILATLLKLNKMGKWDNIPYEILRKIINEEEIKYSKYHLYWNSVNKLWFNVFQQEK